MFTLLNVDLSDGGIYACEAKNQASRLIRWPSGTGYLILFRGKVISKLEVHLCTIQTTHTKKSLLPTEGPFRIVLQ